MSESRLVAECSTFNAPEHRLSALQQLDRDYNHVSRPCLAVVNLIARSGLQAETLYVGAEGLTSADLTKHDSEGEPSCRECLHVVDLASASSEQRSINGA